MDHTETEETGQFSSVTAPWTGQRESGFEEESSLSSRVQDRLWAREISYAIGIRW
jgi:hypothetical protein